MPAWPKTAPSQGSTPIDNHFMSLPFFQGCSHAAFHFGNNEFRIFRTRIVGCDNGDIRILCGNAAHNRPLRAIAIATATEDGNNPIRFHGSGRSQCFFQAVGGVCCLVLAH